MKLNPNEAIGSLAREFPSLIPVFDQFGLDYCCHGSDTLLRACDVAGADIGEVLAAAEAGESGGASGAPAVHGSMSALCDEVEATHHKTARDAFTRVGHLMPRVVAAHGAAHPELLELQRVVEQLREEMLDHMVREERVLFPWLRRLEKPGAIHVGPPWSVKRPIDCMVHDHNAVAAAFVMIRRLTGDYTPPPDACGSFRSLVDTLRELERDTRVHIHKENNILFPAGERAEQQRLRPAPVGTPARS